MQIYHYSKENLTYIGGSEARKAPRKEGEEYPFLIPAFATNIKPPSYKEKEIPVFDPEQSEWSMVEDHRGEHFYDGENLVIIKEIGGIPDHLTAEPILPPKTWDTIRRERAPLIFEADHLVNKAEDNNEDASAFRAYRQALRDITDTFNTPDEVVWPDKP